MNNSLSVIITKNFFSGLLVSVTLVNCLCNFFLLNKLQILLKTIDLINNTLESQSRQINSLSDQTQNLKKKIDNLSKEFLKETSFRQALKFTLSFEGGISNDEGDTGGLTNLGITHTEYEQYRIKKGLPFQPVESISKKEAISIYRHIYWLESRCAEMPKRLSIACFDNQVNTGRGIVALQHVLGIQEDGIAGTETFSELNSWLTVRKNEDKILVSYFKYRDEHYLKWGVGTQRKFLSGWLRRSHTLKDQLNVG